MNADTTGRTDKAHRFEDGRERDEDRDQGAVDRRAEAMIRYAQTRYRIIEDESEFRLDSAS